MEQHLACVAVLFMAIAIAYPLSAFMTRRTLISRFRKACRGRTEVAFLNILVERERNEEWWNWSK